MASELNFEIYQSSENVEEAYEIFANDISNAYLIIIRILLLKRKRNFLMSQNPILTWK